VAEVNERSSHSTPTPHGGGIAIAITWFVGLSYLFYTNEIESSLYYALMVGAILAVVSYLDDLYELSPKVRLITQSSVAVGGIVALGGECKINCVNLKK
jgi:Fuc2NAc and GlcNAc transferase